VDRRSRDVAALLEAFVSGRPGLRLGTCFGEPAVYAGRRVAIRGAGAEVALRLAPAGRARAMTLYPGRVQRWHRGWLYLSPRAGRSAGALASLFEHAVLHVATA